MFTLNIIPPSFKQTLKWFLLTHQLLKLARFVILILIVNNLILLGAYFYLQYQLKPLEEEINSLEKDKPQTSRQLEEHITKINKDLNQITKIQEEYLNLPLFFSDLFPKIPSPLQINQITFSKDDQLKIRGWAPKRDDLISLKENLEQSSYLSEVSIPISLLAQPEDITFEISAQVKLKTDDQTNSQK